jgi:predicted metal-dependent phosphoesterase TrpH
MKKIDLHTHTTASDGRCSPTENVKLAKEKGLRAIAITDHDTVSGIEEALEAGKQYDIEVVPGIEISTTEEKQEIHVLGYFIDYLDQPFNEELAKLRETRDLRNELMINRLNELGIPITLDEVRAKQTTKDGNVGRPHIAEILIEKGVVQNLQEAFDQYLAKGAKAYVNPPRISPKDAVMMIQKYGGVPVLAHPGLYSEYDYIIEELVQAGLTGIEVHHPDHDDEDIARYKEYASKYQLIETGGSDFHGTRNGIVFHSDLGSQQVDELALQLLKEKKKS